MTPRLFFLVGITFIISYVAWWFCPYLYGYLDSKVHPLLGMAGHQSIIPDTKLGNIVAELLFAVTVVGALGTLFFRKIFRTIFALAICISVITSPLWGYAVEPPFSLFFGYISSVLSGVFLASAYFSKLSDVYY